LGSHPSCNPNSTSSTCLLLLSCIAQWCTQYGTEGPLPWTRCSCSCRGRSTLGVPSLIGGVSKQRVCENELNISCVFNANRHPSCMATAFVDAGGVVCPAAISSWGGIMLPMGKGNRRRNFYLLQKPAGHSPKRPISPENVHHCAIPSTQESDIVLPVVADVRSVAVSFLDVRCNVILPPISRETDSGQSRLKLVLCSVSISLGLILALCGDSYGGDAVSYLDMGDSFFSGDWRAIVNALWSPLFPFLHGLTRWVFKPSMRWEPMVVSVSYTHLGKRK